MPVWMSMSMSINISSAAKTTETVQSPQERGLTIRVPGCQKLQMTA